MPPRHAPVDLHAHTTTSDGTLEPRELVELAHARGLAALAVTDHDHVGGLAPAAEAGAELGVEIIPGIEFSVDHDVGSFHLLGYLFDPSDADLREAVGEVQEYRAQRNPRIIQKLQDLGIDVTMADVEAEAAGDLVGRPHMAKVLVDEGVVGSIQEAFDEYLGAGAKAYLPKKRLHAQEAIRLLHGAGGVAVMAHPVTVEDQAQIPTMLDDLVSAGLDGLEVAHSKQDVKDRARYRELADERGLVVSGGSDFHGGNKPDVDLGSGRYGNVHVTYEVVTALRERAERHR